MTAPKLKLDDAEASMALYQGNPQQYGALHVLALRGTVSFREDEKLWRWMVVKVTQYCRDTKCYRTVQLKW